MKVTDHLKHANGKTLFSFEIIPPKKGKNIQELYDNIDPLIEFNPPFIDVTTSREEYIYIEKKGLFDRKITRMRPGTLGICAAIKHKYEVDTIPHVLCGGFTKEETEYLLVDCHYLGINNVMALRGDAMPHQKYFEPTKGGHPYATDLVQQINKLNKGTYLHDVVEVDNKSDFCIGVAGYPEKHFEAPSLNLDVEYLKAKVEAGADYIVTQLFFDNSKYFAFVDKCRAAGITVPIVPGLKPLSTKRQLSILPQIFHVDIPDELAIQAIKCKDNAQVKQLGIEWCIQQSKELRDAGVPVLHYYSMGKSQNIYEIASAIF
jgi:methylenetetrahydrofolate reductase (NADPH)